ncbi:DMT family transporter [uncultured Aliiroseovarius sp.]|uniref:DMT family transporter n=1 Tax=uncultured Aliiroseovarius sp. TaxID=1658783 RepID=UPI0026294163|nr:DMT family transporter [uncultured Aliiroseovarius sp.]
MTTHAGLIGFLALLGAGWGLTGVLAKPIIEAGHHPFGVIFWQMAICVVVLGVLTRVRGKGLPIGWTHLPLYLFIALGGTLLPNTASYFAIAHLPAGIMAIIIAAVPMFAFPIALALGSERFELSRFLGLLAGMSGVALLAGPQAALPVGSAVWVLIALIAPLLYALEGNVVARFGTAGLDPIQTLLGASAIGVVLSAGLAQAAGGWVSPFGDWSPAKSLIVLSSVIHAFVYSGYVWLVGRAGASFAAQVSYLVTGSGVVWAMVLLGESYTGWVWGALGAMFLGLFLVQPRAFLD